MFIFFFVEFISVDPIFTEQTGLAQKAQQRSLFVAAHEEQSRSIRWRPQQTQIKCIIALKKTLKRGT